MPTVKRRIANLIEQLSGNLVVPPNEAHSLHERLHLRRFLAHFGVDCVFDVGANRGQYADMLRHAAGFTGPIISFEPIPELAAELKTRSQSDPNWHVEASALDREAGPATFHVMRNSEFSSLHQPSDDQPPMFREFNSIARSVPVTRSTVAAELAKYRQLLGFSRPFLKLDTQGNDVAVVEGAGESIAAFVGIQSELAITRLYQGSVGFTDALTYYKERGFELSALVPNNAGHFPRLVEIDCILFRRDATPVAN